MSRSKNIPTILAGFVAVWFGVDFLFVRDLTGSFTYYGTLDSSLVDGVFGFASLVAGVLLLLGFLCHDERAMRIGYVLSAAAYLMFAAGFVLQAVFVHSNGVGSGALSALTPGFNYGLLGVWMMLTALRDWHPS